MTKKIVTIVLLSLISATGFSQAFKKNNLVFTAGVGIGLGYSTINYSPVGNPQMAHTLSKIILPITAEFAIFDKWGVGLTFEQNIYLNSFSDNTKMNNYGVFGAFHFVRNEKIELYTRLNVGLSNITYTQHSSLNLSQTGFDTYTYKMKGGFAKPSFGLRLYFTKNIGMFADAGIGFYSISTSKYESSYDNTTHNLPEKYRMNMYGVEVSAGLAFKL